jgi:hypothetical protein
LLAVFNIQKLLGTSSQDPAKTSHKNGATMAGAPGTQQKHSSAGSTIPPTSRTTQVSTMSPLAITRGNSSFTPPPLVICKSDSKPELSDLSADLVPEHCVLNAPILEL